MSVAPAPNVALRGDLATRCRSSGSRPANSGTRRRRSIVSRSGEADRGRPSSSPLRPSIAPGEPADPRVRHHRAAGRASRGPVAGSAGRRSTRRTRARPSRRSPIESSASMACARLRVAERRRAPDEPRAPPARPAPTSAASAGLRLATDRAGRGRRRGSRLDVGSARRAARAASVSRPGATDSSTRARPGPRPRPATSAPDLRGRARRAPRSPRGGRPADGSSSRATTRRSTSAGAARAVAAADGRAARDRPGRR